MRCREISINTLDNNEHGGFDLERRYGMALWSPIGELNDIVNFVIPSRNVKKLVVYICVQSRMPPPGKNPYVFLSVLSYCYLSDFAWTKDPKSWLTFSRDLLIMALRELKVEDQSIYLDIEKVFNKYITTGRTAQ